MGRIGRGTVLWQVWWRSVVVATVGGAVIGGGLAAAFLPTGESDPGDVGFFAYVGAWVGLLLGVLAGLMIGGVAAAMLVPYSGAARTRRIARIAATICVLVYLGLWTVNAWDEPLIVAVLVVGVIGAALTSNFLVNWLIRRNEAPA